MADALAHVFLDDRGHSLSQRLSLVKMPFKMSFKILIFHVVLGTCVIKLYGVYCPNGTDPVLFC